jgi:hypothetical protein
LCLLIAAEFGTGSWNAKLLVGKSFEKSIATYIIEVRLKEDFTKIDIVSCNNEPQPNSRMLSFEDVQIAAQVQKEELLEKTRKLESKI